MCHNNNKDYFILFKFWNLYHCQTRPVQMTSSQGQHVTEVTPKIDKDREKKIKLNSFEEKIYKAGNKKKQNFFI